MTAVTLKSGFDVMQKLDQVIIIIIHHIYIAIFKVLKDASCRDMCVCMCVCVCVCMYTVVHTSLWNSCVELNMLKIPHSYEVCMRALTE